jgi:hypothetical protein
MAVLKPNVLCRLNTITVVSKWANAWIFAELKSSYQHCVSPKSEKAAERAYEFNSTECCVGSSVS